MLFLLLRILFTVAFSHLLRFSQARTRRPLVAAAINYGVAAAACAGWAGAAGVPPHPVTLWLGAAAGFTYVLSLVLMLPAMRQSGVSVTGAVVQLSLMLPVAVAIWRFGEVPNALQIAGMALALVALPLLSMSTATGEGSRNGARGLVGVLFVSTGASQVVMKEFTMARPAADLALYTAALFGSATLFTLLWMALPAGAKAPSGGADGRRLVGEWPLGVVLGVVNTLQLVFLLLALRALPAVVVFPVSACLGIAANALAAMVLWGERPPPAGWVGMALAAVAVLLLNVRS